MAKRSKQRSVRQKTGCMWGIISMFDFRHGRTTKRLLSDRRRTMTDSNHGSLHPTLEVNLPINSQEMHQSIEDGEKTVKPTSDLVRPRVKELIEEDMFVDQDSKKQKDVKKSSKRSFDQEISINHQVSSQKTAQYHDLEALVKEILLIYRKKNEQHGNLDDTGAKRSFPVVEEKLIAAVEVLLNEKSTNGKVHHSKEMFQMLSSNKEMFLKLIRDQDSILLKEDQKSKSAVRSNMLQTDRDEPVACKNRKFFRRRSKSQENISLTEKSRIVILKPGATGDQIQTGSEIHKDGNESHFSFMDIKRRLKHAMGPKKPALDGGWSSPNRDHFYTERFTRITTVIKPGDRVSKLSEFEKKTQDTDNNISNIYVEAKKHLSEMLTSGDEDAESMMRSLPKSLGRILSLREYNYLSPSTSPRAHEKFRVVTESQPSPPTNNNLDEEVVVQDDMACEGVKEIIKLPLCDQDHEERTENLDVLCEPCSSSNGINDDQKTMFFNGSNEDRSSENLKLDLLDANELSSSQTQIKAEELKIGPGDGTEKPSPVSILDPLFSDDDSTPTRTVPRPVEAAVQPLCIQFDEPISPAEGQQIRITNSADDDESAFEYVEAVLLSSDLNWSEFEKRWLSSLQILDPSLFDEMEDFSSQPTYDQKLLFDSTNEVLEDVCDLFIPEPSFIKPNRWPVPKGMDLINTVWSRIEPRLAQLCPRDLDKLVRTELEASRTWLDPRFESRQLVIEIEESIFVEIIGDTLLSCLLND